MKTPIGKVTGVVGTGALILAAVVGCGDNSKSSPSSSSSSSASSSASSSESSTASSSAAAQPSDYSGLLIKDADITAPEPFVADKPLLNPGGHPGVAVAFKNADGSHVIGDTVMVLDTADAANAALKAAVSQLGESVTGAQPAPTPVGTNGTLATGKSPDGAKSVTILLFTQGRAFASLEFDGPPGADPPPDFVTDVGQKQAAAIKAGLPG